jgi:hypothetical protein
MERRLHGAASVRASCVLTMAALVACTTSFPAEIRIDLGEVTSVHIEAIPEGPPAPAFTVSPHNRDHPIGEILPYVPRALPLPIPQDCEIGGTLTITLSGGRSIAYGPCKRPLAINRLWWHYIDILTNRGCRPNCWAGGRQPPCERMPPDVPIIEYRSPPLHVAGCGSTTSSGL